MLMWDDPHDGVITNYTDDVEHGGLHPLVSLCNALRLRKGEHKIQILDLLSIPQLFLRLLVGQVEDS